MHCIDQFLSVCWEGYAAHLSLETSLQISSNPALNIQNMAHTSFQEMSQTASSSHQNLGMDKSLKKIDQAENEAAHILANLFETSQEDTGKGAKNENSNNPIFSKKRPSTLIEREDEEEQKKKKLKLDHQKEENPEDTSKKLWSDKEDQLLTEAVSLYQNQEKIPWNIIAQKLPGKTSSQCRSHWMNKLKPRENTSPWSKEEDKRLILLAESDKKRSWTKIARELGTSRTNDQCRIHYNLLQKNTLGPIQWSAELDDFLKNLTLFYASSGKEIHWAQIAKKMKSKIRGITGVDCRERWENYVNPDLNTSAWTKEEIDSLKLAYDYVKKDKNRKFSWRLVAEKLNTRRSPEKCKSMYNAFSQWTSLAFPIHFSEKK